MDSKFATQLVTDQRFDLGLEQAQIHRAWDDFDHVNRQLLNDVFQDHVAGPKAQTGDDQ